MKNDTTTFVPNTFGKFLKWGILILVLIIVLSSTCYTVKSTQRGVLSTFGKINPNAVAPGLHIKIPFIQTVDKVNIQQKKEDGQENAYTKDIQTAVVDYTINYDLVAENISNLYKNVGMDYHNRIIVPKVRGVMKDAFGNYEATSIVNNRDEVRIYIENRLKRVLDSTYFKNVQFQITEIDYDNDFEEAIKEKQVAEQKALKAKNVTIQIEEQAKQQVITAEAEAKAMQIKAQALAANQKLVEYEAVQKWDGKLPEYMLGNSVPFLNLK